MEKRTAGLVAAALCTSFTLVPGRADAQPSAEDFLEDVADASEEELALLAVGTPFIRTLDTGSDRELTQVYCARVRAPARHIFEQIRTRHLLLDEVEEKKARGFFQRPAAEEDLAALELTRGQVRALEACRPGACDLKLPVGTIDRMHREVDWSSDDAAASAERFLRGVLLETLTEYVTAGDAGGLTYGDQAEPLEVADGFRRLFEESRHRDAIDEALRAHLDGFPHAPVPGVEDVFTWTIEDLGMKSLVALNHIAMRPPDEATGTAVIGIKRFYSSHYFQAVLKTVTVSPATGDPTAPDSYVTIVLRLRFDGELGGMKRNITERRLEMNAEAAMAAALAELEAANR